MNSKLLMIFIFNETQIKNNLKFPLSRIIMDQH